MKNSTSIQGRKSRQLGRENRARIFLLLSKESLTFDQIVEKSTLSRATVNGHLKALVKEGFIEKTLEKGRIVYTIVFNKEKIIEELKKDLFVSLMTTVSQFFPTLITKVDNIIDNFANDVLQYMSDESSEFFRESPSIRSELFEVLKEEARRNEPLVAFPQSKIDKLSKKYPDAIRELLETREE